MREKRDHFWKVFLIILLVLIVLIAAGLFVFWKYLAAYEDTLPETVINSYIAEQGTDYWVGGVRDAALAAQGEFDYKYTDEDVPDVTSVISKGWSSRRVISESDSDSEVYMVAAGGTDVAKLTLKPTGDKSFGFQYWAVDQTEFVNGNEQTVTVTVPQGSTLSINEKEVPESYVTASDVELECEVKEPFDKAPVGVTYTVEHLRGKIELSVIDGNDNELEAETVDGKVQYMPVTVGNTLYAVAPADAAVYAGDYELTEDYMEPFSKSELCQGLTDYVDDSALVRFVCADLYTKPELSAKSGGKEIAGTDMANGGRLFLGDRSKTLEESQKAFIEDFAKRYVSFSTNAGDDIMTNYYSLVALVLPGTELAKRFEGSIEPMSWVDGATVKYNDLLISDFIPLGEKAYVCTLSYSVINSTGYEDRDVQVTYEILAVKSGDTWLVANMLADR